AITIALGLVTIAAHYLPMSVFVLNITTMVGLGVGIDYSLLIVTRFREELNRGLSPVDAAVRTIETAGSAVITSGLTVVVGFAALVTTPLSDTRSVGVGGLLVVAVAVLLATTFLPALLAVLGRNIDRPKWLARPLARFHAPTGWERWARRGEQPAGHVHAAARDLLLRPRGRARQEPQVLRRVPERRPAHHPVGRDPRRYRVAGGDDGRGAARARRSSTRRARARGHGDRRRRLRRVQRRYPAGTAATLPPNGRAGAGHHGDHAVRRVSLAPRTTPGSALELPLGGRVVRAHRPSVPARLRREAVRAGRADRGDLGGGPGARVRDRVRAVDGLRGVP